jgi:hypothetical protein
VKPRIKYGPNQRSHLDDDQFFVVAASRMNTVELKLLFTKLDGLRFDTQHALEVIHREHREKGIYTDPAQVRNLRETMQRRTLQLRWVRRRLLELKAIVENPSRTPPEEKKQRRKDFNDAFFHAARKALPYAEFRKLCEEAAKESDERWIEDDNRV